MVPGVSSQSKCTHSQSAAPWQGCLSQPPIKIRFSDTQEQGMTPFHTALWQTNMSVGMLDVYMECAARFSQFPALPFERWIWGGEERTVLLIASALVQSDREKRLAMDLALFALIGNKSVSHKFLCRLFSQRLLIQDLHRNAGTGSSLN